MNIRHATTKKIVRAFFYVVLSRPFVILMFIAQTDKQHVEECVDQIS